MTSKEREAIADLSDVVDDLYHAAKLLRRTRPKLASQAADLAVLADGLRYELRRATKPS